MAFYGRRKRYPSRRPMRRAYRSSRRTRGRFSRKRFAKYSTAQKTVVRPNINARETFVKLPWQDSDFTTSVNAGLNSRIVLLGNSLVGAPQDLTNISPVTPTRWAAGVSEYAAFYNKYRVLASSVKIQVVLKTGVSTTVSCVLLPIAHGGAEAGVPVNAVNERALELDALTYDQLCVFPYAQSRIVGISDSGNSSVYFKMFRKSKYMMSCKDVRDVEETLARLPNVDGTGGTIILSSRTAWFYYFRLNNPGPGNITYDAQFRMKYYCALSGRTNWLPIQVPA